MKRKIFIAKDKKTGDIKAFEIIKNQIKIKPDSLIGLAVGNTTDGLYKLISNDAVKHSGFWKKVKLFQIDENIGISPDSPISFNYEIKNKLNKLLKVTNKKNVFLMNGKKKPKEIIEEGYKFIRRNKGIDLIILGIGPAYDPHIAYNTKGYSSLKSKLRVVPLHPKTIEKIKAKKRNIKTNSLVPVKGITLGVSDILKCRKILLIAYGREKAESLKLGLIGKLDTKKVSASAVQLHKNLEVVIDKEAGRQLNKNKLNKFQLNL